ncbi:MAG: hypothetical protein ACK5RG_07815 [Cyclobacteriaceae bacterium]|jgi:hypothetical protein|nr:superoxide dismutase family protein [Flammeovirgaceae bacterium]
MKYVWMLALLSGLTACQKSELVSDFTGNQAVYSLAAGSAYNVNGTVTFKERKNGTTTVLIELTGTEGDAKFPVHLHLGDISTPDAEIALLLSPLTAASGKSETVIKTLANETQVTYKELLAMAACVKVHLAESGPSYSVILAAGNIGTNGTTIANGRTGIAVCQ